MKNPRPPERRGPSPERRRVARGGRRERDRSAGAIQQLGDTAPLVLVVDDYPDGREMLTEYLQFVGFRVEEARTGVEALDKVKSMLPDVVVLDLALPDMDGLQVLAHLNEFALVPPPKVAVWTARVLDNIRQRVAASGVTVFIPKPCEPSVIAAQIADLAADAHRGSARRAEPA